MHDQDLRWLWRFGACGLMAALALQAWMLAQ
jgi:hypothetical protein